MANIKFSAFTAEADIANFDDIVGYQGVVNKKITPANLASSLVTLSGGPYLPLAGGTMVGDVIYNDNIKILLGTGGGNSDIYHNGTDMSIRNLTAVGDMNFSADSTGGGGAATAYFSLDGGLVITRFYKGANFQDDVKLTFGDPLVPGDLEIYHDTNDSIIVDTGTGSLKIGAENFHVMDSTLASYMMTATPGAECNLYFNGSGKFVTTNTGVLATGNVDMTGGVSRTLGARVMQEYTWPNGTPVAYTNWANGVFSNLPYDTTPTIDVTDCNVANYGWVCTNAAGGTATQEATFTLGAAGAGTWRIKVLANWFDQTANVITEGRLNINGTSYEVIAEAAVESTTDKIYYGEKIITLAAGATVQFGMIFTGGGVTPFPSVGTTGNTPNSIYFEKVL